MDRNQIAQSIWDNHLDIRPDNIRWHQDGFLNKQSLASFIEETACCLDLAGAMEECKLDISDDDWNDKYFDDPGLIAAMAKLMYNELKSYDNFDFEEPEDWTDAVLNSF